VVVAADRERRLVYSLRWSGFEPGAAPELAAIALDRARSPQEFREALKRWRMPARRVTYAAIDGLRAFQEAALVPVRHGDDWTDWMTLDDLPHGRAANEEQRETGSQQRDMSPVLFAHPLATT